MAILLTVALMVGGAAAYLSTLTDTYTARAVVLINPVPGSPLTPEVASSSGAQHAIAMETESGLVSTPAVARLASESLDRLVPAEDERLGVEVPTGTQMIRVTFTSGTPERAEEGAQAFAEAVLENRRVNAESSQEARLEGLRRQAAAAEENLRRATVEASSEDADPFASVEVQLYSDRLAQLNASLSTAQGVVTNPGEVINPAELPEGPDGVPPFVLLGGVALVGVVLGGAVAVLREWAKDLVRENEVQEVGGLPVFAHLVDARDAGRDVPGPSSQEAFRRLRAAVVATCLRPHVLAIAAVGNTGRTSTVTANLAVSLEEAGFRVAVVAANPGSHGIEGFFATAQAPGLAEVLNDEIKDARLALVDVNGVKVLPRGKEPLRARERYAGPVLRDLVGHLGRDFDYVLIDASGTGTADGDAAISAADSVLLVVTSSRTTHAQILAALDRFEHLDISAVGAVNVPAPRTRRAHADPDGRGSGATDGASADRMAEVP